MNAQHDGSTRRFTGLVNPIAGKGAARRKWETVARLLIDKGHAVNTLLTEDDAHATLLAKAAAGSGDIVVAVGGDGLVRDVAAGVVAGGGALGIVPSGRGNDLAGLLEISADPTRAAASLHRGNTRAIDVLDVNGAIVPGNVYVGVDSLAARYINGNRRLPALALYRGAGLAAAARWQRTEFTLTYVPAGPDGQGAEPVTRRVHAHDIVIANSGRYGNGLQIVPGAELDDGVIDVLIVGFGSPWRVLSVMLAARSGKHVSRDDVEVIRATSLHITSDRDVPFGADGDEVTTLPADVKLIRKALPVIVD